MDGMNLVPRTHQALAQAGTWWRGLNDGPTVTPLTPMAYPTPAQYARKRGLDAIDYLLVVVFLIGFYTHWNLMLSATTPIPAAPSGLAGILMLWKRREQITGAAFAAFIVVMMLYLVTVVDVGQFHYLGKRTLSLVQLTYSLVISYALFLTLLEARPEQVERLFLTICLMILIGCLAEDKLGLRGISDAVRHKIYGAGVVYEADVRDTMLYGHVRPKFFASEPAAVTFSYVVFAFTWLVTSSWKLRLPVYLGLMGVGILAMPGPTLLLMLLLLVPYQMLAPPGQPARPMFQGLIRIGAMGLAMGAVFLLLATTIFANRMDSIGKGNDPSFYYRVIAPVEVTHQVMQRAPMTGDGLGGIPDIDQDVSAALNHSAHFKRGWPVFKADVALTNFFWLHWIYLGLVWGSLITIALSVWLKVLGVPSVLFCWGVWAIMGQASGAYVGPETWTVLFMPAAAAILRQRQTGSRNVKLKIDPALADLIRRGLSPVRQFRLRGFQ